MAGAIFLAGALNTCWCRPALPTGGAFTSRKEPTAQWLAIRAKGDASPQGMG